MSLGRLSRLGETMKRGLVKRGGKMEPSETFNMRKVPKTLRRIFRVSTSVNVYCTAQKSNYRITLQLCAIRMDK